jgi:hypothetical protein
MMQQLQRSNLYSLEDYAAIRNSFREDVIAHKKLRQIQLGEHVRLMFEDQKTMQYQVQEMLRIERIFEAEGIQEELDAYNPLIPDGTNLKATMLIEYSDVAERKAALAKMIGIENMIYLQVEGYDKVHPIANEDLDRDTEDKTSSVHFMRFEFTDDMISALKGGAALHAGVEHPAYSVSLAVDSAVRDSLVADFD